jgi:hypothetical protein
MNIIEVYIKPQAPPPHMAKSRRDSQSSSIMLGQFEIVSIDIYKNN